MKKHDIVCLQETKTDDLDVIEINGFKIKMKNRAKYGRLNSEGIILHVAYENELSEFITLHDTESKFAIYFEISKKYHNF